MADAAIVLSPHQQAALDWLVTEITAGKPLVALRGLAGVGKSAMIPHLVERLRLAGRTTTIAAPTHRAAMILRRKGLAEATTVHHAALTPYFTADFATACAWLGEDAPCRWDITDLPHEAHDGVPWLVWEAIKPDLERAQALKRQRSYPAKKRLESVGIHGREYFAGFGAKAGEGVLIIDEGSMVGTAMLELCQQAFPQIVLVGDPGQLPPVKDVAQLATVEGYDLSEIHRQAVDSPIVQLAYRARNGEPFWRERLTILSDPPTGDIVEMASAPATAFLTSPLIVWKNETRRTCTHAIRSALGFTRELLYVGEPLVCRSTSKEDRAEGHFNNALYRIVEVDPTHPRRITVENALGEQAEILAHIEDLDGTNIDPRSIPFRLGYILTCHTAQGGEWPTVYISLPDLRDYVAFCGRKQLDTESRQWTYTAITRAKATLIFLNSHTFTTEEDSPMATPSRAGSTLAPMLTTDTIEATPGIPEDDIPEVEVPRLLATELRRRAQEAEANRGPEAPPLTTPMTPSVAAHGAVIQGALQALQGEMGTWMREQASGTMRSLDGLLEAIQRIIASIGQQNEHAQYQLATALAALQEHGLLLTTNPYQADVQALSPQGYPVTLHLVKHDAGELTQGLQGLTAWLAEQQYTVPPAAVAF